MKAAWISSEGLTVFFKNDTMHASLVAAKCSVWVMTMCVSFRVVGGGVRFVD